MQVVPYEEVMRRVEALDLLGPVEAAFKAYSQGRTICPPPGEMLFEAPDGEVHVKFGHIAGDPLYVVKIASGFWGNPARGLPTSDGMMLAFSRSTGEPVALLLDRGRLTDLRTAAAGAVCGRYLGPERISTVGVLGAGIQAELQVRFLQKVRSFDRVLIWARNPEAVERYRDRLATLGIRTDVARFPAEVAQAADLVITATACREPLLSARDLKRGLHITAVGADSPVKQELAADLLGAADLIVVDSRSQCATRGELGHALAARTIDLQDVVEIGEIAAGLVPGRRDPATISISILTGLAVQDIAVCAAVLAAAGEAGPT